MHREQKQAQLDSAVLQYQQTIAASRSSALISARLHTLQGRITELANELNYGLDQIGELFCDTPSAVNSVLSNEQKEAIRVVLMESVTQYAESCQEYARGQANAAVVIRARKEVNDGIRALLNRIVVISN